VSGANAEPGGALSAARKDRDAAVGGRRSRLDLCVMRLRGTGRWRPEPTIGRVGARAGGKVLGSYFKMLIARAITSAPMPRDTIASIIISSLAHRLIAETSVGPNAVAVQKASDR
jgi:hypothetical protein